jgi:hypothetical protein
MSVTTEPKTVEVRADELKPSMVRIWRGLHSGKIVQQAEVRDVQNLRRHVQVRYVDSGTISRIGHGTPIEVLAEGFEF